MRANGTMRIATSTTRSRSARQSDTPSRIRPSVLPVQNVLIKVDLPAPFFSDQSEHASRLDFERQSVQSQLRTKPER